MPTIEVDVVFFVVDLLITIFAAPFVIGWSVWRMYRNPEFWLKLRKKDWVYVLVKNPLGRLLQIVVPTHRIGADGEIRLFGGRRTYYIRDHDTKGRATVFQWRKGKPGYLYDWDDPNPQAWAPNQSLNTDTDPETITSVNDNKLLKQMMLADFYARFTNIILALSVISILVVAGMAYLVFNQTTAVAHLTCILSANGNATQVAGCR